MNRLAGEFENQRATVILFPFRTDVWRDNCAPIRQFMVDLANKIAEFQPVVFGVLPKLVDFVKENYKLNKNVKIIPLLYNDCWARDTVSSIVVGEEKYIASFKFNAYGAGLYTPWDDDERIDLTMAKEFNYKIKDCPVTLEGGNIAPDGKGTLFCIKDSIVNANRNPQFSIDEVEKLLKEATASKQIVWIPQGLVEDETGGHIDNVLAFVDSNTIIHSWTDEKTHPQYQRVREIEELLKKTKNAEGKEYSLVRLPLPPMYYRTKEDAMDIEEKEDSFARVGGEPVLETYTNFALINGAVIVPQFGIELDKEALSIIQKAYPDRKVIPFYAREATLGGGGLHCLTKHIN